MGTPSHGSAVLLGDQLPGDREIRTAIIMMAVKAAAEVVARAVLLLGPANAVNETTITKGVMDTMVDSRTTAMVALPPLEPRLGTKHRLLEHSSSMEVILAATLGSLPWALLLALEHLLHRRLTT